MAHRRNPIRSEAYGTNDLSVDGPFVTSDQFVLFIDMVIVERYRRGHIIRSRSFDDQPFSDPAKARALLDEMTASDAPTTVATSALLLRIATFSIMQQRFGISA